MRFKREFLFHIILVLVFFTEGNLKAETLNSENDPADQDLNDSNPSGDKHGVTDGTAVGEIDLELMTNEELEEICTSRGFDVVKEKDEKTGKTKVYSHEDYVMAAQQCLDIEAEMEEVLANNPELIHEIEEEAEKMRLENERLEKEIATMIKDRSEDSNGDVENLKQEKERLDDERENLDRVLDAARHSSESSTNGNATDNSGSDGDHDNADKNDSKKDDGVEGKEGNHETISIEEDETTKDDNEEVIDLDTENDETKDSQDNTKKASKNVPPRESSHNETTDEVSPSIQSEPFTIGDIVKEVRDQIIRDFTAVADLILPKRAREQVTEAMKPIGQIIHNGVSTILDMVKRYAPGIFKEGGENGKTTDPNAVATLS